MLGLWQYAGFLLISFMLLLGRIALPVEAAETPPPLQFVFIDPALKQRQLLAFGPLHNSQIVFLEPEVPLLTQVAKALHGMHGVRAIHLISEGESGAVLARGTRLDSATLATTDPLTLANIRAALVPGADMLLYGCHIGRGEAGQEFVAALANAIGIDVAASDNDTGHASLGADWKLEVESATIETAVVVTPSSQQQWHEKLAIGVTVAASTTTLINAMTPTGANGLTYSGTPTVFGSFASNAYGTFTTTGSNLGMPSGAVFGTGNVSQVSGTPGFFWDGAGTGVTSGIELDRAALTLSFAPDTGVTKIAFRYIMGSEEYNEYVGQNFSDNITIRLTGGAYSGTNVATVPGGSVGIDIDTINLGLNSAFYRDNTVASPPVPDSVLDGHTTLLQSITVVNPGTTYSAEIKVADYQDNRWNTALFVNYFGASLLLDLDGNNSSGATLANYQGTFTEGGTSVAIVDTDRIITNYDTTSIASATITLTNAMANDSLTFSGLPAGITGTTDTSVPGVIRVTLSGASTIANYQTALSTLRFSNSSNLPNATTRNLTVVVNDGATNSNTAQSLISIQIVPTYLYTVAKSASTATIASPGTINYTITLVNTGDGNMTGVNATDNLAQGASNTSLTLSGPTGDAGVVGQFDIGETWSYTATLPVTQLRLDDGNNLVNTVSVTSTQTTPAIQTAQATTTITRSPTLTITKSANTAGPVAAGNIIGYTYSISNTGNITINNVAVSDVHNGTGIHPVPGTETLTGDVAPTGDSTDVTSNGIWSILAPGDTIHFTANYTVTQSDIDTLQ